MSSFCHNILLTKNIKPNLIKEKLHKKLLFEKASNKMLMELIPRRSILFKSRHFVGKNEEDSDRKKLKMYESKNATIFKTVCKLCSNEQLPIE